jgi:phage shock protein A
MVVVEANLFARITRLVKSVTNNVVTAAEDPEKLLDTVVSEMQDDLIKMRQAAAQVRCSSACFRGVSCAHPS